MSVLFQASPVLTSGTSVWIAAAYQACVITVVTVMVVRYGLLVTAVAFAVGNFLEDIPLTLSLSHWTATTSNLTLATVLAVTCFGFTPPGQGSLSLERSVTWLMAEGEWLWLMDTPLTLAISD